MELNITNEVDRRLVVNFPSLNEEKEKLLLDHLIEFIVYYSKMVPKEKQVDAATAFDYYYRNVVKPYSIEVMLKVTGVAVDAIRYIEQYYSPLVELIESDKNPMIIDRNKNYDRNKYLDVMKHLLEKHRDKREVREIIRYLKVHGLRENELSDDYVRRIVKRLYAVC